jgi:hypothetical protein
MAGTLGRIALWMALVVCCAWPPAAAIAPTLSAGERAGTAAGVVVWIGVTAWIQERRRRASNERAAVPLAAGAAVYAALQGVISALFPPSVILGLYAPAVILASRVLRLVLSGPDLYPLWAFVLTLACGAQALLCALAIGRSIAAASGR